MGNLVETFGNLDLFERVRIGMDDGTTIEGRVSPIDYVPEESFRAEVEPNGEENVRYEFSATYEDEGWSAVNARRCEIESGEWESVGKVETVESMK